MKKKKKQKHKKLPNLACLRNTYIYDAIKGQLFFKDEFDTSAKLAGYQEKNGYWSIYIKGQTYKLHRILFYIFHGRDPAEKVIDHINGDKGDNRILNLRAVTNRQNLTNTKANRERGNVPALEPQAWKVLAMPV
jgi:hypothetical protein